MNLRNDQEIRLTGCGRSGEEPMVILRFLAWVMNEWWYHSVGWGALEKVQVWVRGENDKSSSRQQCHPIFGAL